MGAHGIQYQRNERNPKERQQILVESTESNWRKRNPTPRDQTETQLELQEPNGTHWNPMETNRIQQNTTETNRT